MGWRQFGGVPVATTVLLAGLILFGSCAKKRPIPVPPPVASTVPPPQESAPSVQEPSLPQPGEIVRLTAPEACEPWAVSPWQQCRYVSPSGESLVYYLSLPPSVATTETLPIVTFLHGSSGSGPGDEKPISGGHQFGTELWVRHDVQARHPSIVLVPQADPPAGETWVRFWRAPAAGDPRPKEALVLVMEILSMLQSRYPVDARRLYLTGQSMGGFGAWLAYTRYPGHFAAIVPVCGGGDPGAVVPNPTAVWAFHGARDAVVPVKRAREMVSAIEQAGGQVRYREYPNLGHNIFEEAFSEPELVDWIFAQKLPENEPRE